MKTKIIIATFILCSQMLLAQISSIDLAGGIGRSFYIEKSGLEEPNIAWKAGVNFNIRLTEQVYFKSGIVHSQIGYTELDLEDLRWPSEHDGNGGFEVDPNLEHRIKRLRDYRFIEIPLELRFEFLSGKIQPYVEGGVGLNLYRSTKAVNDTDLTYSAITSKESSVNQLNFFGNISLGANFLIDENFQSFIQAGFSRQINNLRNESSTIIPEEHLYQQGISLGIRKLMTSKNKQPTIESH